MAEYIGCRECDSPYCKGCNLKNLETMLRNGKFDCIMNENRCINIAVDVAPVVHGRWEYIPQTLNTLSQFRCPFCRWWSLDPSIDGAYNYCPNCGAKMDGGDGDAAD